MIMLYYITSYYTLIVLTSNMEGWRMDQHDEIFDQNLCDFQWFDLSNAQNPSWSIHWWLYWLVLFYATSLRTLSMLGVSNNLLLEYYHKLGDVIPVVRVY